MSDQGFREVQLSGKQVVFLFMLYFRNKDKPGFIGGVGTILGNAGLNIGDFRLGRSTEEGVAVSLISLDSPVPDDVLKKLAALPQVSQMRSLKF